MRDKVTRGALCRCWPWKRREKSSWNSRSTCASAATSQSVCIKSFCKSQFPHKFFDLFFKSVTKKKELTNLCWNWLLQNGYMNTSLETRCSPQVLTLEEKREKLLKLSKHLRYQCSLTTFAVHPSSQTLNPTRLTLNPEPSTLNPKP